MHPGRILREEFLLPIELSPQSLAQRVAVRSEYVDDLIAERVSMTPDMAVRLARFFGTSAEFWMELQSCYELAQVRAELAHAITLIQPFAAV